MPCLLVLPCLIRMLTPWQEEAVIILQRWLIVCCSRRLQMSSQSLPCMTVGRPLLLLLLLIIKLLSHLALRPEGC